MAEEYKFVVRHTAKLTFKGDVPTVGDYIRLLNTSDPTVDGTVRTVGKSLVMQWHSAHTHTTGEDDTPEEEHEDTGARSSFGFVAQPVDDAGKSFAEYEDDEEEYDDE